MFHLVPNSQLFGAKQTKAWLRRSEAAASPPSSIPRADQAAWLLSLGYNLPLGGGLSKIMAPQ
jgi:hypothetical protein